MTQFAYTAMSSQGRGELVSGRSEADTEQSLRDQLHSQGLIVLDVRPVSVIDAVRAALAGDRLRGGDAMWFFQTLSMLLESQVPIESALSTMTEQAPRPRLARAVGEIRDQLRSGEPFADALARAPGLTRPEHLALIRAGQESGRLSHAVTLIDASLAQRDRIRRVVIGQLIYPVILLLAAIVALWFLTSFVMPRIADTLGALDQGLPWQTQITLDASRVLVWVIPPVVIGAVLAVALRERLLSPSARRALDARVMSLPIVGTLRWHGQSALIADAVATMIEGGGDVLAGLDQAHEVVTSPAIAERLNEARTRVREGVDLGQAMKDCRVFPPMVGAIVQVGMQTGDLNGALRRAASMCIERQERLTERLLAVMSPILILIMALTVGWVVYSLITGMMAVNDLGSL